MSKETTRADTGDVIGWTLECPNSARFIETSRMKVDTGTWWNRVYSYKLVCEYCGCISEKEYGTCEHCGAPLVRCEF